MRWSKHLSDGSLTCCTCKKKIPNKENFNMYPEPHYTNILCDSCFKERELSNETN